MKKEVLLAFVVFGILVLSSEIVFGEELNCDNIPASGDWGILGSVVCEDRTIILNGDLIIYGELGSLIFRNVELRMNGDYDIIVRSGGSFKIYDWDGNKLTTDDASIITNGPDDPNKRFSFIVENGAVFEMKNSFLSYCGYNYFEGVRGLEIYTKDTSDFTGNTVTNNFYGISLYGNGNTVSDNTFEFNYAGIFLEFGAGNNIIRDNTLQRNLHSVLDNSGFFNLNTYQNNIFLQNLNETMIRAVDMQQGVSYVNNQIDYVVDIFRPDGPACAGCIYSIVSKPNEVVSSNYVGDSITGSFTPSQIGLYSLLVNVTDGNNNYAERKYIYLVDSLTIGAVGLLVDNPLYFRSLQGTHGQPVGVLIGQRRDIGTLLSEKPSGEEIISCSAFVLASPDDLLLNFPFIIKDVKLNLLYKLVRGDGYVGLQREVSHGTDTDLFEPVPQASDWTQVERNFMDINWPMDYSWSLYWMAAKLHDLGVAGDDTAIKSEGLTGDQIQSIANFSLLYTTTPEIRSFSEGSDLLSATAQESDINYTEINIDSDGLTDMDVLMPSSFIYDVYYDGFLCDGSGDCTYTQNGNLLNIIVSSDGKHMLEINPPDDPCAGFVSVACGQGACQNMTQCEAGTGIISCASYGGDCGECCRCIGDELNPEEGYDPGFSGNLFDCEGTICLDSCIFSPPEGDNNGLTWDWADDEDNWCIDLWQCTANECGYQSECHMTECNAECEGDEHCGEKCGEGQIYYAASTCLAECTCDYGVGEDCDSYDGWYDTGVIQWVETGECTEKEQKRQEQRDYSCDVGGCDYIIIGYQWIDTGNTRNKPESTPCDDGLVCTEDDVCDGFGVCGGVVIDCDDLIDCTTEYCEEPSGCVYIPHNEQCGSGEECQVGVGCVFTGQCFAMPDGTSCDDGLFCTVDDECLGEVCIAGLDRDCSASNWPEIAMCDNEPDANPYTWDYRESYISTCDEGNDECTSIPEPEMTHTCDSVQCNAPCESGSEQQQCGETNIGECTFGVETRDCQIDCTWGGGYGCNAIFPVPEIDDLCMDELDNDCDELTDCDDPTSCSCEQANNLVEGLNFVSLPLNLSNMSVGNVFTTVMDNLDSIYTYENGRWEVYRKNRQDLTTITEVETKKAYIVIMENADTLNINGNTIPVNRTLQVGWNLVGISEEDPVLISDYLAERNVNLDDVESIWDWDILEGNYTEIIDFENTYFESGKLYWIELSAPIEFAPEMNFFERIGYFIKEVLFKLI